MANFGFKDPGISQPAFHQYLWDHANRSHEVLVNQCQMGDLLGVTRFTIARHLKEMVADGRLTKLKRGSEGNRATYRVADPADFPADPKAARVKVSTAAVPERQTRRQLKWG